MEATHVPVLKAEVLKALRPGPGKQWLDGTLGLGGHASALLEASPGSRLLGLDKDPQAQARAARNLEAFGSRVVFKQGSFADMDKLAEGFLPSGSPGFDGILLDLGVSSLQLDDPARGFSFRHDAPLDLRMDPTRGPSAAEWLETVDEEELSRTLFRLGEEPQARRVSRAILKARPVRTTFDLARAVEKALGGRRDRHTHPATRTFQAVRMAVNHELEDLAAALPKALALCRPSGRIAVISFHSLEDRPVKEFFGRESTGCLCPPELPACRCGHVAVLAKVTRKPVFPGPEEVEANPRSRSARLRVVEKI